MNDRYCSNARQIGEYIGESWRDMNKMKKEGLPIFRTAKNGNWKAKKTDLDEWLDKRRIMLLKS